MKTGVDFKELKNVEKKILEGIKLEDNFSAAKTIGAFDIAYINHTYKCVAVVLNIETKEIIEETESEGEEVMPYSPNLTPFREGSAIVSTYRKIKNKPDILMVKGMGAVHSKRIGLANYVGVILNKPCIGVSKELAYGRLEEERIMFDGVLKGIAIKVKPYSNPVFVSPGHNISLNASVEITKKVIDEQYKMPLPLHLAHKHLNKLKKNGAKE